MNVEKPGRERQEPHKKSRRNFLFGLSALPAVAATGTAAKAAAVSANTTASSCPEPDPDYARRYYDLCRR